KNVNSFLFYVLDFVGKDGKGLEKPKKNGNGTFRVNPLVILDIPSGFSDKNIEPLIEANNRGTMYRRIWQIKYIKEDGFQVPVKVDLEDLGEELVIREVPADIREKYAFPVDKHGA